MMDPYISINDTKWERIFVKMKDPKNKEHLKQLITDAKGLYDSVTGKGSPGSQEDGRCGIEVTIIREGLHRMKAVMRWVQTGRMIADGMTKDNAQAGDLIRSVVREGRYQVADEDFVP